MAKLAFRCSYFFGILFGTLMLLLYWQQESPTHGATCRPTSLSVATAGQYDAGISSPIADNCEYLFFDIGANIGVQTRKLFEPEKYPDSVLPTYFSQYFGAPSEARLARTCAFGVEPNPQHEIRLKQVESALRKRGRNVNFLTKTAVGADEGEAYLYGAGFSGQDGTKEIVREVGATLLPAGYVPDPSAGKRNKRAKKESDKRFNIYDEGLEREKEQVIAKSHESAVKVKTIDLSKLLLAIQGQRVVIVKMDIEGIEYKVLSKIILEGALCKIDVLLVEWHSWFFRNSNSQELREFERALNFMLKQTPSCNVTILAVDDESYSLDGVPL